MTMIAPIVKSPTGGTVEYYDLHAKEYCDLTRNLDLSEAHSRFLSAIVPGGHILDAGAGSGRDTSEFLRRGYNVTAIDASFELARLAAEYAKHPCEVLRFQDMVFHQKFDAVWACASLLHIAKSEMCEVIPRFVRALKPGGVLYVSLKEGEGERIAVDGRFFSDYTRASFENLMQPFSALREIAFWRTEDLRSDSNRSPWLSFLFANKE